MYQICRRYDTELLRYDYNEPHKEKNHCDQKSAAAKTIIRSYVDATNYDFGVKDSIVCVAGVDIVTTTLIGPKVPYFTSCHSISFTHQNIKLWQYFGVW